MESRTSSRLLCVAFALSALLLPGCSQSQNLSADYYSTSCPNAGSIVRRVYLDRLKTETNLAAQVLRLFFHDAFVTGVDASLLLNSTDPATSPAEKDHPPSSKSLHAFDVIEEMKAKVESKCPGVVSCSDVLTMATRVAIKTASGPDIVFNLGRLDGNVSKAELAEKFLPNPTKTLPQLETTFSNVGLDRIDLVVLSGGHTLGVSHCTHFISRINGSIDKALNPSFAESLMKACHVKNVSSNIVDFDNSTTVGFDRTSTKFDNRYFKDLLSHRGLLKTDHILLTDHVLAAVVRLFASNNHIFLSEFKKSMMKLSELNLRNDGNIRRRCGSLN